MRLDCPACAASYDVPDALLPGRRAVRCARCGHQWPYRAPEPLVAAASAPRPDAAQATPPPPAPLVPRARQPRGSAALRLAWAGSLALVALALVAALALHRPISRDWPPSLRLYAALGLEH